MRSEISSTTTPPPTENTFLGLPDEIVQLILQFLNPRDLGNAALANWALFHYATTMPNKEYWHRFLPENNRQGDGRLAFVRQLHALEEKLKLEVSLLNPSLKDLTIYRPLKNDEIIQLAFILPHTSIKFIKHGSSWNLMTPNFYLFARSL